MGYPAPFHKLVMIGDLYTDVFNVTLSMIPVGGGALPAVTQSLVDAVGVYCADWFNNGIGTAPSTGIGIFNVAKLTSVKLNRIGTDGRYVDPETREYVLPVPVSGTNVGTPPPQLSLAATLRGPNERARAGKGRMFFPVSVSAAGVGADGRITAVQAKNYASGVYALLTGINDVYLTAGVTAVAGIASKTGAGAFQAMGSVSCGRVVDTIRSRRSALDEAPEFWPEPL